jgi:hypothetical protein
VVPAVFLADFLDDFVGLCLRDFVTMGDALLSEMLKRRDYILVAEIGQTDHFCAHKIGPL